MKIEFVDWKSGVPWTPEETQKPLTNKTVNLTLYQSNEIHPMHEFSFNKQNFVKHEKLSNSHKSMINYALKNVSFKEEGFKLCLHVLIYVANETYLGGDSVKIETDRSYAKNVEIADAQVVKTRFQDRAESCIIDIEMKSESVMDNVIKVLANSGKEINLGDEKDDDGDGIIALRRTLARADNAKNIVIMTDLNKILVLDHVGSKWRSYGPYGARKYPYGILSVHYAAMVVAQIQPFVETAILAPRLQVKDLGENSG